MAVAKKVTINDVALAAGVSVSTVSLVLSGKGRISPATGQRVNEAVEQLGFVRNRQASALRGGQSGVIGLIVRDLTSPFYAELTAGLTEALEAQGRMVFLLHGGREADQLLSRLDMLLNQGVDGVIVAGASGVGSELCERAAEKGVPLVFASRASYLDEADTLRPDNMQAAQMLTEHLIRRGHQRIAWLGGKSSSLTRAERVGGYCALRRGRAAAHRGPREDPGACRRTAAGRHGRHLSGHHRRGRAGRAALPHGGRAGHRSLSDHPLPGVKSGPFHDRFAVCSKFYHG